MYSILQKCTLWVVGLCIAATLQAQLPSGFTNSKIQEGYTSPMGIVFSSDGQRMFSWDKSGHVFASNWNGATYIRQTPVVLDLSEEVGDWRDFGLLSLCLDPNFNTNGLIYLFYVVDRHHLFNFGTPQYSATTNDYFKSTIARVTRYRLNLGTTVSADNASRRILLGETRSTGIPLAHESHGGGTLLFGRDGSLLLSTGDNASYTSTDRGSAPETYWQQGINDGILRPAENVGSFRSQMLTSLCGKILRLDPNTGDGLASNPHYQAGNPRSATSRMWAMGLRNPFRMTLQPNTGSTNPADANPGILHLSDVGYVTWEDYHIIHVGGLNLGWPVYEGQTETGSYYAASATTFNSEDGNLSFQSRCVQPTSPSPAADPQARRLTHYRPAIAWKHGANEARVPAFNGTIATAPILGSAGAPATGTPFGGNCASGILYYTGTALGAAYQNTVFFSDYAANWIRVAETHNTDNHWLHNVREFAPSGFTAGIVCMAQGPIDQSVYYVNINNGTIYKIALGGNRPPIAVLGADRTSGTAPMTVNFNSTGSNDPEGTPISYAWDFGDGTTSTLPNPQKTFNATGAQAFTVRLTVRDAGGLTDSKTLTISLNSAPPTVRITNPVNNAQYSLAEATNYSLQAAVGGNINGLTYAWQVTLRHNTHEHRESILTQANPTIQISPVGCDGETYYYLIECTVRNSGGLTARDSVKIYPNCSTQNLNVTNIRATPQQNAVSVAWNNPTVAFDEVLVVAKAHSGFQTNPTGTNYIAQADFLGNGTAFEGGKVVYRGTGTSVLVTNLTGGRTYYFRVFTRKGSAWTGGVQTSAIPTAPTTNCTNAGWYTSYFNNVNLTGTPVTQRVEAAIDADWGLGKPNITGIGTDNFSIRWESVLEVPTTGNYTFSSITDDGIRLWVNNQLIINKWIPQSPTTWTGTIALTAGQKVPIKMEYYEAGGGAVARLRWSYAGVVTQPIPQNRLCATNLLGGNNFVATSCYRFMARHSGKVMEVENNITANGANAKQNAWIGGKNQIWRIKPVGGDYYQIVNGNSGRVLDVAGNSTAAGANLVQWDWVNGSNQKWKFTRNAAGYYVVSVQHSGQAIDVFGASLANNVQMTQYPIHNGNNQQFQIAEVGCPAGTAAYQSTHILAAQGFKDGRKAVISWLTNANEQQDYYVVEKLGYDPTFEKLEYVNARPAATGEPLYYAATDAQPSEGLNTYRVALYRNGSPNPQYSDLIHLDFSYLADYFVYPNPAQSELQVDLEPVEYREVQLHITDLTGKILQEIQLESAPKTITLPLEKLGVGSYLLRIGAENRREVIKKFTILR